MKAVITTGGKQYLVKEGQTITVEKLETEVGKPLVFEALMTVSDTDEVTLGTPVVKSVKVTAEVKEHGRGDKILIVKYKPKVRYRRHIGHRQPFTKLLITKIA
ncbi:50S ribosomal protein L21 [Candidatus Uhrbacteria bacterium]|nr:50S ribosomal protein L21 [Candidatus Uhrbacteria bacterium]